MSLFKLTVNGQQRQVEADPEMPLLWALRDRLGLVGAKYGCGIGLCGACTVHVNGDPVRSCSLPMSDLQGAVITTIEGLASGKELHALQQAWIDEDVAQCGYCQSGQIMSAAALLAENANPSDDDIDKAMVGNYCRCGTYVRIRSAIHRAAGQVNAAVPSEGPTAGVAFWSPEDSAAEVQS
jgi:isoquinoline 1-oxidoreductase subunit alpha